jgi:hypothetical protein
MADTKGIFVPEHSLSAGESGSLLGVNACGVSREPFSRSSLAFFHYDSYLLQVLNGRCETIDACKTSAAKLVPSCS